MVWFQALAIVSFALALGLAWELLGIRKHLNLADWTPTRSWKKRFGGKRHTPRHSPDQVSDRADEHDRRFYRDTSRIADWLNDLYADTPWAFENTGRLEAALGSETGSEREIVGWYNGVQTCWIKLSTTSYEPRHHQPVRVDFELINGRMYGGREVLGLAQSVAGLVCATPEELCEARDQIHSAMIDAMWQLGGEFGNPQLEIHFSGALQDHVINWRSERVTVAAQRAPR